MINRNDWLLRRTWMYLSFLLLTIPSFGQVNVEKSIEQHATSIKGKVGVSAMLLETGATFSYHGNQRYPMQSVYKFPIGMAVLHQIDQGKLRLDQKVLVPPSDYIPQPGYSPIRDKFPEGADLSIQELLRYSVMESDGSASDALLKVMGGIEVADEYIHELGVKDMAIAITEKIQVANDTIQYQNWSTPEAMTKLLKIFYTEDPLSEASQALLLKFMIESKTGTKRLKGLLPSGTIVAHKTGTSATYDGLARATNDAGIIILPNGHHMAISVFISDAYASPEARDQVIASISKTLFDHWSQE
jgi:beta-lactamase class A